MSATTTSEDELPWLSSSRLVELIGRFTVERQLGVGGSGTVFECRDTALGRRVAIKLQGAEVADPSGRERFAREAKALATVRSPYVVTVFEVGEERGYPFIVMEYLEGEDLETIRSRGALSVRDGVRYMRQVAEGLSHIHAAGIVHRDVKPANILIEQDRAVLVDFGLATPMDGSERITSRDLIPGTAAFMSPEQMRGQVDLRTDIYAVGATLYALIGPKPPFLRRTTAETVAATLNDVHVPLEKTRGDVPPELSALVDRLLDKDPARRPESMDEVADALREIIVVLDGGHERADASEAIHGSLKHMALPELLQSLEIGGKTAKIILDLELDDTRTSTRATLAVERGQVVSAVMPGLKGPDAFYKMAEATDGRFTVQYDVEIGLRNVDDTNQGLLLEAFRRLDEKERAASGLPMETSEADLEAFISEPIPTADPEPFEEAVSTVVEATEVVPLDSEAEVPPARARASAFDGPATTAEPAGLSHSGWGFGTTGETRVDDDNPNLDDEAFTTDSHRASSFEQTNTQDAIRSLKWRVSPLRRFVTALVLLGLVGGAGYYTWYTELRDPRVVAMERLAAGEEKALLVELAGLPAGKRLPFHPLVEGHAHAKLGDERAAIDAYHRAAVAGVVDDKALRFLVDRLEVQEAKALIEPLTLWPDAGIKPVLEAVVRDGEWWARHHAWYVLKKRKQDDGVDVTELGILDLKTGPTCNKKRYGLQVLQEHGVGERALAEVRALRDMDGLTCIDEGDVSGAEEAVLERTDAARALPPADQ